MAANSTSKVASGARFKPPPAPVWNNMVAAGQAFADGQLSSGAPDPTRSRSTDMLKLKNSSGAMRRKGEILKIDGAAITTVTDEHIWLDGIEPTDDCRFGILKEPAGSTEVVTAQVSGVCIALVNITNSGHTYALPAEGEYVLQSGESGPLEILYSPSGTGELECVVRAAASGAVKVIGPCAAYTPDMADPDTDFETTYPGGCEGPDVLGLNIKNLSTGAVDVQRMEVSSTSPLTLETDSFSFTCASGSVNVYAVVVFNSLSTEGVVCSIHRVSDDSVLQAYTNTIYSWNPLAGGNLQCAPDNTSCTCGTLPFDLCFSVPTR